MVIVMTVIVITEKTKMDNMTINLFENFIHKKAEIYHVKLVN